MSALLEQCASFLAELVGFEPSLLSGDDCRVVAERLARVEKACAAARARAAARAAACGAHRQAGFDSAADWMGRWSGSSRGAAAAELSAAEAAERCPQTKEALASGQVSLAQAGEIARTEADCPGSEPELLDLAKRAGLGPVREEARKLRLAAIPAEELAARQHKARSFRHWLDDLGMVRFSGAIEPLDGVAIMNRLDAEVDRIRRAARRDGSTDPWEAHAADAFVKMMGEGGRGKAGRADVVIVCDLRAYRRGHAEDGEACHIVGGSPVPVKVVADLIDDAFVKAVTHHGVRIDTVVHYGRHISAELRTALELGDPPGFEGAVCVDCGRRYRLEWDHLDPVANHGPTSFKNLKGRCWPCHQAKTERDREAGLLGDRWKDDEQEASDWHDPP